MQDQTTKKDKYRKTMDNERDTKCHQKESHIIQNVCPKEN